MKTCPSCNVSKPLADFWVRRDRGQPASRCKPCSSSAQKKWRQKKPGYERQRYLSQKVEMRERHLVRKYGITLADYQKMLTAQGGNCAICARPEQGEHNRVFHVDHCHSTGVVRGLLCRGCNHVLGHVADNPQILQSAIAYLIAPPTAQIPELIGRAIAQAEDLAA